MASKFSRSGVFASSVDYFCLVCECRLRDERDAYAHVTKPVHIKNFDVTEYFEKNIEDRVRKIKKWYFCEFCNHLLSTAARVRLHVMEPQHLENKNTTFLERYGSLIVAFGKVLIDDKAWNGIIDDMCAICNTEFEDENIHKNETAHIIKLIQNKVEFDAEKNLFRKIDNSSFQCLTCNMVIALNEMSLHFDLTKHKTLYQKNFDFTKITEPKKIDVLSIKTENSETQNKTKITENDNAKNTTKLDDSQCLDKGRRNQQDVVKKTENKIHGNISKRSVNKVNDDTINKPTLINDAKICEILGAKNYITTDENKKVWCILCNWCMNPMEIHSHINDQHHQTILKLHRERIKKLNSNETYTLTKHTIVDDNSKIVENPPSKGNILDFIETFQKSHININLEFQIATCKKCSKCLDYNVQSIVNHIEEHTKIIEQKDVSKPSPLPSGLEATKIEDVLAKKNSLYTTPVLMKTSSENGLKNYDALLKIPTNSFVNSVIHCRPHDVIINEKICINIFSLLLLVINDNQMYCVWCETNVHNDNVVLHFESPYHCDNLDALPVIIEQDNEFIREVRPNCFHCGYCNIPQPSWEAMETHLQTTAHKESKNTAHWRLQFVMPEVVRRRLEKERRDTFMMQMLFRGMFPSRISGHYDSDSD